MTTPFDPARMSDDQLEQLIGYLKKNRLTSDPRYAAALMDHDRRFGKGLTIPGSLDLIREAAAASPPRWVSYTEISAPSGRKWGQAAVGEVNKHLGRLCEWAVHQDLPMFSAWVVRKEDLETGELKGTALKGFLDCARAIGLDPGATEAEQQDFIAAQRARIVEWAGGTA